jgi:hypothetical protein
MQNFIVMEFTRNAQGNIGAYPSAKETEDAAYAKYYDILSKASTSNSPVHGAILMTYEGFPLEYRCFKHEQPEPEPTPEPESE